jgi:hypothetical protein
MWKNLRAPGFLELLFDGRVRMLPGHSLTPGGWEILPYPPYSPDLAQKLKKQLRGQHFHSNEHVQNKVKKWLCAQDVTS